MWSTIGLFLWTFVLFPVIWILEHVLALLSIIFAPLLHVLQYALHAILVPFSFLAKFETVYIFFGTAVLLGLLTGLILYVTTYILGPMLGMERRPNEPPPRTAASYRAERAEIQARKAQARTSRVLGHSLGTDDSDWALPQSLGPPTAMMGTMILEEGSSSE